MRFQIVVVAVLLFCGELFGCGVEAFKASRFLVVSFFGGGVEAFKASAVFFRPFFGCLSLKLLKRVLEF